MILLYEAPCRENAFVMRDLGPLGCLLLPLGADAVRPFDTGCPTGLEHERGYGGVSFRTCANSALSVAGGTWFSSEQVLPVGVSQRDTSTLRLREHNMCDRDVQSRFSHIWGHWV